MTIALMSLAGFVVGFALDNLIARLAREPYERREIEEEDLRLKSDPAAFDLASEAGSNRFSAFDRAAQSIALIARFMIGTANSLS